MKPTDSDVMSGRGASFNQHPGNVHFRKIIDEQKDAYMSGTKKQKIDISKAVVEAIYSMDPPGRFLKKCPETNQWEELSTRDAADRVAQAMAYAVSGREKSKRRREAQRSLSSARQKSLDDDGHVHLGAKSSPSAAQTAHLQQYSTNNNLMSGLALSQAQSLVVGRGGALGANNHAQSSNSNQQPVRPGITNLQQQLIQNLRQSNTAFALPSSSIEQQNNVHQNGLGQLLARDPQQQTQQLLLQYTLGRQHQAQASLQPALLGGLASQLLNNQAQQQQRHQLLLQCYLNQHQNALQSASLASPIALSAAPFLAATRSQSANNNLLMNLQQAMNASNNTLLLGSMLSDLQQQSNSNAGGVSSTPQISQQIIDQLLSSQMLQQNHELLASSSLGASSSDSRLPLSRLELQQPLDPLLWQLIPQGALPLGHNTQGVQPAPIDLNAVVSANSGAPRSTGQKESKDEEQKHKKAS